MNIIICGAGRVGFTIAKQLTEQNHSITVIDQSSDDIQKINESLDVKAIVGKATSPEILDRANTAEADMLIAVTRNDEINMLICQISYSLFKVPKKIARIRSQEYLDPKFSKLFNKENLPIDYVISPELEIAKSLQRKLEALLAQNDNGGFDECILDFWDEFLPKLLNAYKSVKVGNPLIEGNLCGPLHNQAAVDKYEATIEKIKNIGGKIISISFDEKFIRPGTLNI